MGLYISLKRKVKDEDFNRFKSAFYVFDELFSVIFGVRSPDHKAYYFWVRGITVYCNPIVKDKLS